MAKHPKITLHGPNAPKTVVQVSSTLIGSQLHRGFRVNVSEDTGARAGQTQRGKSVNVVGTKAQAMKVAKRLDREVKQAIIKQDIRAMVTAKVDQAAAEDAKRHDALVEIEQAESGLRMERQYLKQMRNPDSAQVSEQVKRIKDAEKRLKKARSAKRSSRSGGGDDQPRVPAGSEDGGQWTKG